jgi:hypothetical protein
MVRTKTLAADIDDAVNKDLRNHFFVCDTAEFLDSVLPVPQTWVEKVFKKLCKDSIYEGGRWACMPVSDSVAEENHYKPFIDIAKAISDAVKAISGLTSEGRVNGIWVDRHSKSPKSPDEDAAETRPDCLHVTSNTIIKQLDIEIAQAKVKLSKAGTSAEDKKTAEATVDKSEKRREREVRCQQLLPFSV